MISLGLVTPPFFNLMKAHEEDYYEEDIKHIVSRALSDPDSIRETLRAEDAKIPFTEAGRGTWEPRFATDETRLVFFMNLLKKEHKEELKTFYASEDFMDDTGLTLIKALENFEKATKASIAADECYAHAEEDPLQKQIGFNNYSLCVYFLLCNDKDFIDTGWIAEADAYLASFTDDEKVKLFERALMAAYLENNDRVAKIAFARLDPESKDFWVAKAALARKEALVAHFLKDPTVPLEYRFAGGKTIGHLIAEAITEETREVDVAILNLFLEKKPALEHSLDDAGHTFEQIVMARGLLHLLA